MQAFDTRFIHKRNPAAVMVTDVRDEGGAATADFAIRREHSRRDPAHGRGPVTVGLELFRQIATAGTHVMGDVPLGHAFIAQTIDFSWTVDPEPFFEGTRMLAGRAAIRTLASRSRAGAFAQHTAAVDIVIGDRIVANGTTRMNCLPPRVYHLLRAEATSWEEAELRHDASTLADAQTDGTTLSARLGWNAGDRFIFDHPLDHLPAAHLIEAAIAAHTRLAPLAPARGATLDCSRFAELSSPVTVTSSRQPDGSTETEFRQRGASIATVHCLIDTAARPVVLA